MMDRQHREHVIRGRPHHPAGGPSSTWWNSPPATSRHRHQSLIASALLLVTEGRRGTVGVEVMHLIGLIPAFLHRRNHASRGPSVSGPSCGKHRRSCQKPDSSAVDPGALLHGMLVFFEDQHASALTEDEPSRPLSHGRPAVVVIVAGGEGLGRRKTTHRKG